MKNPSLLLIVCMTLASAERHEEPPPRPNIVVIMADDMGIDDVSFHGSKQYLTPNIDALAYYGVILQNMYTPPMCTPSRAAFMTGKYPIHTGTQHYVISNEAPWGMLTNVTTIAEVFKEAGYSTNLIGKWHLGFGHKAMLPTNRGFDSHYGYLGGYVDYYQRRAQMPVVNTSIGYDFRRNLDVECADRGTYLTDLFTREAEAVICAHDKEKPLFLVVNHLAPHTANEDEPLQALQEEIDKFQYIKDVNRRTYAAMVSRLDDSIGNITRSLDENGILNNTIILFYSDNGAPSVGMFANTGSNWPLRGQKNTPLEGGIRVAGAIWSPLLRRRRRIFKQNMHISDWFPTLATASDIAINESLTFDGLDLWEDLSNAGPETFDREMLHMLDDVWGVTSYQSGNLKYINGTTLSGFASGVLTSRTEREVDPRNARYSKSVLGSTTGRVLAKYDRAPLTAGKINSLRSAAQIRCGNSRKRVGCDATVEECLYQIDRDPCERNNLARLPEYAGVLDEMREAVNRLRATAVPPAVVPGVPNGDPSLHQCTWTPYMDEPVSEYVPDCGYQGLPCEAA